MLEKLIKRELVDELKDDWTRAKDWASVRLIALAGVILTTYQLLPPEMKAVVPQPLLYAATMVVLGAAVFGRMTKPVDTAKPEVKDESDPANPA